ncbi:MAG: type IV pilus assembly protein PilM [Phycisphaerae bacterium]
MASGSGVWGIEIGQCGLKAMKLRPAGDGQVELVAFDIIEHAKILSQPDAEADELSKAALEKFVSRNELQGDTFVVGVPGQQTFSRFCKLPPVDPKKIPDIVRFEASQQIPFDMDDVVWDYQVFTNKDSPDVEVGIFAMRNDLIRKHMEAFNAVGIGPSFVQTIPCALYNFCRYDGYLPENGATVVVDVGAQNTDLVIVEANSAWNRNIPLGGNNFTEAVVKAFKLGFARAENEKRNAAASKYARQIFQAMRPVFAELVAEIQRSLGFYSSTHREVELKQLLACGNAFRLTGLPKYLENNLTLGGGVVKLEKFNKIVPTATSSAPNFTDNLLGLGVAYGLALQGLGLASISANLLPPELARVAIWKKKQPYFIAAAACVGLAAALPWTRSVIDSQALAANRDLGSQAQRIITEAKRYQEEFGKVASDTGEKRRNIDELLNLQKDRAVVPRVMSLVFEAMPEVAPELAKAQTPEQLKQIIQSQPQKYPRAARKQLILDTLSVNYFADINAVAGDSAASTGGATPGATPGAAPTVGMMPAGGGGKSGRMMAPTPQPSPAAEAAAPAAPGFLVKVSGRMLYGTTKAEALSLLSEVYIPEIKRRGQTPGLGFYVPDDDPTGVEKKNFGIPRVLEVGAAPAAAAPTMGGYPGGGGGGKGGGGGQTNPGAMVMGGGGPTGTPDAEAPKNLDPATGEDMSKDYRFEMTFKVRMGDAPPKPAEGQQPPTGG